MITNTKIDVIDNGYILSYVKHNTLGPVPHTPVVIFFKDKKELIEHLQGVL
jgi:hypothetical protein